MKVNFVVTPTTGVNLASNQEHVLVDVAKQGAWPLYKNVIAFAIGDLLKVVNPANLEVLIDTHRLNVWVTNIRPIKAITIEV